MSWINLYLSYLPKTATYTLTCSLTMVYCISSNNTARYTGYKVTFNISCENKRASYLNDSWSDATDARTFLFIINLLFYSICYKALIASSNVFTKPVTATVIIVHKPSLVNFELVTVYINRGKVIPKSLHAHISTSIQNLSINWSVVDFYKVNIYKCLSIRPWTF